MKNRYIRNLTDLSPEDRSDAGGKAYSLGRLLKLEMPVPAGFVLLATAYDAFLDGHGLRPDYERMGVLVQQGSADDARTLGAELASRFNDLPLPDAVASELSSVVHQMVGQPLVVRSSATVEDTERAAWAGQLQTFLNVPTDDVSAAVRHAWASLFLPRALSYAAHRKLPLAVARVAVILQHNVDAVVSGVIFTTDPISQNEDHILLEAVFGLGETLVSGVATPDSYWIDKSTLSVLRHRSIRQHRQLLLKHGGGTQILQLGSDEGSQPKLTGHELQELARMAITVEGEWDCAVDIEWCRDDGGRLLLLQARPITTLSASPLATSASRPQLAKSITRGWSLLFCQIWHRAYTDEFYRQFGWGLSEVIYDGRDGVVTVYRAPAEFVTGMTEFVTQRLSTNRKWMHEQATQLIQIVDATREWLSTVTRTPLSEYSDAQLQAILAEFISRNVELGPRYVLMLWYPIQMETHPERAEFADAINAAIDARVKTHSIGGSADEFARQFAAEVLRRVGLSQELARATPRETLEAALAGKLDLMHEHKLRAYSQQFLVTSEEEVRHEEVAAYCVRKGIPLLLTDERVPEEDVLHGVSAFPGKARGMVQIIRGPQDFTGFRDGNVLVTSMTTPDFEVVMGRAVGIITDEGGATSHAAILARELRVPTVIGTQRATQMFAVGELAEVNGDDGIALRIPVADAVKPEHRESESETSHAVLVVEDSLKLRRSIVSELYHQAHEAGGAHLQAPEEGNVREALATFRRERDAKQTVNAVIVDLKLEGHPKRGVELVQMLRDEGYPASQIYVYSRLATSASAYTQITREEILGQLRDLGVSKDNRNLFGKVPPGSEALRESLEDPTAAELANIQELVAAVLHTTGITLPTRNA